MTRETKHRIDRIEHLSGVQARAVLIELVQVLWPTEGHEWTPETLETVARIVREASK